MTVLLIYNTSTAITHTLNSNYVIILMVVHSYNKSGIWSLAAKHLVVYVSFIYIYLMHIFSAFKCHGRFFVTKWDAFQTYLVIQYCMMYDTFTLYKRI